MTDTLTKPTRFRCFVNVPEQKALAGEQNRLALGTGSTSILRRMVERTAPIFYTAQDLGQQYEWQFYLIPQPYDLFGTFSVLSEPVVQTEIEDLDLIFHCCRQEANLNRQYLATFRFDLEWDAPDPYELWVTGLWHQEFPEHTVSDSLQTAVMHTIEIARTFSPTRVGPPAFEVDPDVAGKWWVAVPVWFRGSPEDVLSAHQAITRRFVKEVVALDRRNIRLDVRVSD